MGPAGTIRFAIDTWVYIITLGRHPSDYAHKYLYNRYSED
jgi:hypothetical protein